ncbi:rho GTPase-activating protein gacF [Quercus lobata]|uniref:Uncharacterized protein n=1 Tax=Quercus lobata TaxID=97700 RepID=A0A7N2LG77_QUELO|nr:rho GTPase-activating protein gacF [Quercus lobata]
MVLRNSVSETETPPVRAPQKPQPQQRPPHAAFSGFGAAPKPQPSLNWLLNPSNTAINSYQNLQSHYNSFGFKIAEPSHDSSSRFGGASSYLPPNYSPLVNNSRDQHHHHHRRGLATESTHESESESSSHLGANYTTLVDYSRHLKLAESTQYRVGKLGESVPEGVESENRNRNVVIDKAAKKKSVRAVSESKAAISGPVIDLSESPPKRNSERKSENLGSAIEKSADSDTKAKSKLLIRIKTKSKSNAEADTEDHNRRDDPDHAADTEEPPDQTSAAGAGASTGVSGVEVEVEAPPQKTWNLRPRKPATKNPPPEAAATAAQHVTRKTQPPTRAESTRSQTAAEKKSSEKKEKKPNFSIALSKEDIEKDFLLFTGSKPARRPKKRSKIVQKQLDNVFPGLWLSSVTPESYQVTDSKG